jgi:hypothetical protein
MLLFIILGYIIMTICGYFISDYYWLFYWQLLVPIYFTNGY